MQEPLSVSDLLPEDPQPTISRRYTLEKIPAICPHCGQRCIRQDTLRVWYCGLCGAYQERKETVRLAFDKSMSPKPRKRQKPWTRRNMKSIRTQLLNEISGQQLTIGEKFLIGKKYGVSVTTVVSWTKKRPHCGA
jgi:ribosomal protein S27AE